MNAARFFFKTAAGLILMSVDRDGVWIVCGGRLNASGDVVAVAVAAGCEGEPSILSIASLLQRVD